MKEVEQSFIGIPQALWRPGLNGPQQALVELRLEEHRLLFEHVS
jgi:hypothetical protein